GEGGPIFGWVADREAGEIKDVKGGSFYAGKKNKGWVAEIAVPWSALGNFKAKDGAKLAFEIRVNDADTSHERWKIDPSDLESLTPGNPASWSYLILNK
ncbi:MAG: hypothetical protein JXR97_13745, partial [Planctomycetes bacterium]|nr:hypothetical protein [Planctomycetota bacterium]